MRDTDSHLNRSTATHLPPLADFLSINPPLPHLGRAHGRGGGGRKEEAVGDEGADEEERQRRGSGRGHCGAEEGAG